MPDETVKQAQPPTAQAHPAPSPSHLLYSIFARIGGSGLDTDSFEALRASYRGGFLGKAVAYDNRQSEIPAKYIHSLRWHPVRLISSSIAPIIMERRRNISTGSLRGNCSRPLRFLSQLVGRLPANVACGESETRDPSLDRDPNLASGSRQRETSAKNKVRPPSAIPASWKSSLLLERERFLEEYDLADLVVVLSEKAAETFRARNFSEEKLFYLPRGVDTDRFKPGTRPPEFRAIFSGALIERKGIHHLLEAWHRLNLTNAELWLLGAVHDEAKPHLKKFGRDNIRVDWFRARSGKLSQPGNNLRLSFAMGGQRKNHLRSGGLRFAAGHHARSGRRRSGRHRRNYRSAGRCRCDR